MPSADHFKRYGQFIEAVIGDRKPTISIKQVTGLDALIKHQQPSGAFLPSDPNANPEVRWYDELVILHSMANHAVMTRDPAVVAAVKKSAEFHLQETQPDHATAEPWGLLAFIQYAPSLADQVLHAVQMQYADGVDGVPLSLLTEVQYGLRQLLKDQSNDQ